MTKSRVSIRGKLHQRKHVQLACVISVIVENQPHAHHKAHLHTKKGVMIFIPSLHGLRQERLGACPPFCDGQTKTKGLHFERTRASINEMPVPILCFEIIQISYKIFHNRTFQCDQNINIFCNVLLVSEEYVY